MRTTSVSEIYATGKQMFPISFAGLFSKTVHIRFSSKMLLFFFKVQLNKFLFF